MRVKAICLIVATCITSYAVSASGDAEIPSKGTSSAGAKTNATEMIFMGQRVKIEKGGGDFADVLNKDRKKASQEKEQVPPHKPDDVFLDLNGEKLTWKAIDRRVDSLLLCSPLDIPPEATPEQAERVRGIARSKLSERVANRYVRDALLAQKARAEGMTVSKNEINAALNAAVRKVPAKLRTQILVDAGSPDSCFYREQENYLLTKKYRKAVLAPAIKVSAEEIAAAIKERNESIATLTASNAMMRPRMEMWLSEIRAGKRDFGKTAYDFSDCPSSMEDGRMGDYDRDCSLSRPLKEFAFSPSTNENISAVLETPEAYHILKVLARHYDSDDDGQDIEFDDDDEVSDGNKGTDGKSANGQKTATTGRRPSSVALAQIMLEKHKIPPPLTEQSATALVFKRKLDAQTYSVQYEALKKAKIKCAVPVTLLRNTERKARRRAGIKSGKQKSAKHRKSSSKSKELQTPKGNENDKQR